MDSLEPYCIFFLLFIYYVLGNKKKGINKHIYNYILLVVHVVTPCIKFGQCLYVLNFHPQLSYCEITLQSTIYCKTTVPVILAQYISLFCVGHKSNKENTSKGRPDSYLQDKKTRARKFSLGRNSFKTYKRSLHRLFKHMVLKN